MLSRRETIALLGGAAIAGALPRPSVAQSPPLSARDLRAGLAVVEGAGANVVVAETAAGLVLVDGGTRELVGGLSGLLRQRYPERRAVAVFNANWRLEHTGGNETWTADGARVLAHENTKLYIGGDFFVEWEDRHYTPRPKAAWPTETFYFSGKTEIGGLEVEYLHLPRAHTDGDVAVFFPEANVLAASDLLAVNRYPIPDYETGGWIGGFEQATKKLLERCDAETIIVPAEGPPQRRAALEAQLTFCSTMLERVGNAFRNGMSLEDFVATAPTREFDAERGNPQLFLRLLYKGAFAHIRQIGGVI